MKHYEYSLDDDHRFFEEKIDVIQNLLVSLPRWAKIAFLARCTQKVLPLCKKYLSQYISKNKIDNCINIIMIVEISAENSKYMGDVREFEKSMKMCLPPAGGLLSMASALDAAYIAGGYKSGLSNNIDDAALDTVRYCIANEAVNRYSSASKMYDAIYSDLKFIYKKCRKENWNDNTPVSQKVFCNM